MLFKVVNCPFLKGIILRVEILKSDPSGSNPDFATNLLCYHGRISKPLHASGSLFVKFKNSTSNYSGLTSDAALLLGYLPVSQSLES